MWTDVSQEPSSWSCAEEEGFPAFGISVAPWNPLEVLAYASTCWWSENSRLAVSIRLWFVVTIFRNPALENHGFINPSNLVVTYYNLVLTSVDRNNVDYIWSHCVITICNNHVLSCGTGAVVINLIYFDFSLDFSSWLDCGLLCKTSVWCFCQNVALSY